MIEVTTPEPSKPLPPPATVDVILPTRNRARYLSACLDSIRAQTAPPNTVFVVDDGSTDNTGAVLAGYARNWPALRVIRTGTRGVSAARNAALALSTAQLVAFIDSDDIWDSDKLARQIALFTADRPQLGLVHCGFRQIDEEGRLLPDAPLIRPSKRGRIFRDMLEGFYGIAPSTIVARRDVVAKIGGFDESLVQAEDRDLCLKLACLADVDYVPDTLVSFRIHDDSSYVGAMKDDPELVLLQRLKVWDRWFDEIVDLDAVLRQFRDEALSTSLSLMFRRKPDFGLYGRLARSEMRLATSLFPDTMRFSWALASFAFRASNTGRPCTYEKLKFVLATYVILPNNRLLRLAQKFGRFRNVDTPAPPHKVDPR